MLDATFHTDPKLTAICLTKGEAYGWKALVVFGLMRQHGPKLDTEKEAFWPWLAPYLRLSVAEAKEFLTELCDRFGLLSTDGRYIWSERLVRDVEKYQAKCAGQQLGGKIGAEIRKLLNNGQTDAAALLRVMKEPAMSRQAFLEKAAAAGLTDADKFAELIKENGRECILHYALQCSEHLQATGAGKDNFAAYMSTWIRTDKVEGRGWFKTHAAQAVKTVSRKVLSANKALSTLAKETATKMEEAKCVTPRN